MKYQKLPVIIDAIQWDGLKKTEYELFDLGIGSFGVTEDKRIIISTLEGQMTGNIGDFIIKGTKGEFYPCKPDIFAQSYKLVDQ